MTTRARITTQGFEEYLERIVSAGMDVDAAAGEAVIAGGDVLLDGMTRRVPKDTHNLEEHLARGEPKREQNFTYVWVGMRPGTDAETARYGNAQEYGTSSMPAQSYIRATRDQDSGKARKAMKRVFERWLKGR